MTLSVQDITHHVLDVRPLIKGGVEPFNAIMEAVDGLSPGQSLLLIAPFKPAPLFSVMERKGFSAKAEPLDNGDWQVLFSPVMDATPELRFSDNVVSPDVWPEPSRYLDCSDMQPPEPMVRILAEVEDMPAGTVLFALLHREPLFLFPELENRGHEWVGNFDETGAAYRIMIRVGDAR
ncbi:DUF2249 domain-containing protein [Brucella tritici]|uniref:DUF2249 domain-containing protein n=1 Tax=Brucella tritici TaxID=94626 RepID=A0A6N6QKK0_9HYPH|nr:DUF2249 domain-containing protein [Brucella tritici]KAB2665245.1 DUF2249 domain-containing protein [Brucella tritici]KAB2678542.1 DUF2249 domain-containing protein [Brucella tritici]KAB2687450.1 DUF2249 domain-containing protein [Brucella tritici]NKW09776.1 DUF2249 domain-containing protein [Brucella tritici]